MRIQYVLQEIGHGLRRNLTMVIAVVVSTASGGKNDSGRKRKQ